MGSVTATDREVAPELLVRCDDALRQSYDPKYGGFGTAPKFPARTELRLLLRLSERFHDPVALDMVKHTLTSMARGGMYDQVGAASPATARTKSGSCRTSRRCSTTTRWLTRLHRSIPETRDPFFEEIAKETLDYVLLDMTSETGAFFSTQDATAKAKKESSTSGVRTSCVRY